MPGLTVSNGRAHRSRNSSSTRRLRLNFRSCAFSWARLTISHDLAMSPSSARPSQATIFLIAALWLSCCWRRLTYCGRWRVLIEAQPSQGLGGFLMFFQLSAAGSWIYPSKVFERFAEDQIHFPKRMRGHRARHAKAKRASRELAEIYIAVGNYFTQKFFEKFRGVLLFRSEIAMLVRRGGKLRFVPILRPLGHLRHPARNRESPSINSKKRCIARNR